MKKKIIKGLLFFLIGFIVFFGFRLLYGYIRYDSTGHDQYNYYEETNSNQNIFNSEDEYTRKNIASTKYNPKNSETKSESADEIMASPPPQENTDQKYEKIGNLSSTTKEFENTEKKIRDLVKKYEALIQYERKTGLPGNRWLTMVMGVPPENFDAMISDMKVLGKLTSIRIDKVDKTNEYKELNAKKVSLEKTLTSLNALKSKGGQIGEYLNLEQQILDYERQLQDLGVMLGDYDSKNEFCTVNCTLSEDSSVEITIPFLQRFMVALEWTIKYYGVFMVIIALGALSAFLIVKVVQLIKWLQKPGEKKEKV